MVLTTLTASSILRPADIAELLVEPTLAGSVAAQVATRVDTSSTSFRIPRVVTDPVAQWVAEGQEISPATPYSMKCW